MPIILGKGSNKVACWQSRQVYISSQLSIKQWTLAAVCWSSLSDMGLIIVTVAVAQRQSQSRCAVSCRSVSSLSVDPFTVVQGLIADHNKITETPDTGLRLLSLKAHSPRKDLLSQLTPGWPLRTAEQQDDLEDLQYIGKCKSWMNFIFNLAR